MVDLLPLDVAYDWERLPVGTGKGSIAVLPGKSPGTGIGPVQRGRGAGLYVAYEIRKRGTLMQIDKHVNMVGHAVACKYLTARMMFPGSV